jgi:hypothetical protein
MKMKLTAWVITIAAASLVTTAQAITFPKTPVGIQPVLAQGSMQMGQDRIAEITRLKGKPGSADLMRKYYKDLNPIGIQPGGAGMVVNLYSKKEDTTLSLCTTFDVVVAVRRGRVAQFAAAEVK